MRIAGQCGDFQELILELGFCYRWNFGLVSGLSLFESCKRRTYCRVFLLKRTPWYLQTDFNIQQNYKVAETKTIAFSATLQNLFNQRSVTAVNETIDSGFNFNYIGPNGLNTSAGTPFYQSIFQPYNIAASSNAALRTRAARPATVADHSR
jgi:hypothetical protein